MGRIIDRAVTLYRRNFLTLAGIIALMQIPVAIVQIGINVALAYSGVTIVADPFNPPDTPTGLPAGFGVYYAANLAITVLSTFLIGGIATAALAKASASSYLGDELDIIGAYQAMGSDWVKVIGGVLAVGITGVAAFLFTLVPCVGTLMGSGILFFLAVVINPLVPIIIVLEGRDPFQAVRRAWELARRRFWWLLGFALLVMLFARLALLGPINLAASAFNLALTSGALGVTDPATLQAVSQIVSSVFVAFTSVFFLPLEITAMLLAYFDIRIRTEGWDISLMANEEATTPQEKTRLLPAWAPARLIEWEEAGYFTLITIGFFGVVIGLYLALLGVILALVSSFAF
jgi:hypothetical protein